MFVGKILNGAKTRELPIERPEKFELESSISGLRRLSA